MKRCWLLLSALAVLLHHSDASADLFAVVDRGIVFRSIDDGATWAARGDVPEPDIVSLTPALSSGTLFLLGRAGDVWRSSDAGASWTATGNAGAADCEDIVVGRSGDPFVLTRTGDLIRSQDGGATWAPLSNGGASDFEALTVGPPALGGDSLFAVTATGDVVTNAGALSSTIVGNTGYTPVLDLVWTSGVLHAITEAGEILRSIDSGRTWSAIGTVSQVGMRGLAVIGSSLRAITKEGEVAQSADGVTWSWSGTVNQVFVVALSPGAPEFLTGIGGPPAAIPGLAIRARPNPFSGEVRLALEGISDGAPVEIAAFDAAGRRVGRIHSGQLGSGARALSWTPERLAAGVYFVRLTSADGAGVSERITILR